MGKGLFITPAYLSFAWTLMITYQMFTETAVKTVMSIVIVLWPQLGQLLSGRVDMIVFIYAFSWVFLLSSVIPSVLLGKEKGVIVQFFIVLTLTLTALFVQDILVMYTGIKVEQLFGLVIYLQNPILASLFLSAPYIFMVSIDLHGRLKRDERKSREANLYKIILLQEKKIDSLASEPPSLNDRRRKQD